jgi:hypothetical protein
MAERRGRERKKKTRVDGLIKRCAALWRGM